MIDSIGAFLKEYWPYVTGFAVMAVLVFLSMRLMSSAREKAEITLKQLYHTDIGLYMERLENNRRLRLIFRKPIMDLFLLDGYMKLGREEDILRTIGEMDRMKLEPRDKVDYYQKRLSYFVSVGNGDEARKSRDMLTDYLRSVKATEVEKYRLISEEADIIIGVYIDRDTTMIKKLTRAAAKTKNDVMRGVNQFRIAKLYYFKGDEENCRKFLESAKNNLKDTYYEPIIGEAEKDLSILNTK